MSTPEIRTHATTAVLTIELWRREKKNALTTAMYIGMADALSDAAARNEVRAVVLRGQADLFTAGNDLSDFLSPEARKAGAALRFLRTIAEFPKPIVAAVGGPAIGIGTTMLLHCDLVIAADTARFQLPFTKLGLSPEGGSSLLLPQLAGHRIAAELLLLGDVFDAVRAREAGIVNQVVAEASLLAHADELATRLSALPADAIVTTKAMLKRPLTRSPLEAINEEYPEFERLLGSAEARAAFQAFLTKRSQ